MLIVIEDLLTPEEAAQVREPLETADWRDGAATAGALARSRKHNQQLDDAAEPAAGLSALVLAKVQAHPLFVSAALPRRIFPPKFNRYADGGTYDAHVDSALMRSPRGGTVRSDVSATLFLCDPADYDGGELEIESAFGAQSVKLPAGGLVLYPSSSLHRVSPVTRGARLASFFWIESLVADDGARTLLFDLDQAIQALSATVEAGDDTLLRLTHVYHNLLRRWARP